MQVSANIRSKVATKINECIAKIESHYKVKFKAPHVRYDIRGTTAGTARPSTWELRFNPTLLVENLDDFIADTVPHEVAHLACDMIYPEAHKGTITFTYAGRVRRGKREIHGPKWQSIMRVLGADPSRCHDYDTSNVPSKSGSKTTYEWSCNGCGKKFHLLQRKHDNAIRSGAPLRHRKCGGDVVYGGTGAAALLNIKPSTPVPTKQPKINKYGTKLEHALALYKENSARLSRAEMINLFVNAIGMSKAGAATYYYTCQKRV